MRKDPELYEVFDYFRKVLIDELDNADFGLYCCVIPLVVIFFLKGGVIMRKDPELYEVFDYFRKVLIDELDNADIVTLEGRTIKTAVVTATEKVCSQLKPVE